MKIYDLLDIVDRLKHFCRNTATHVDRVTLSSQLVYREIPHDLALGIKPGFAPDKISIDMSDLNNPLILISVEVGEKCKVGDFIRMVKRMEETVCEHAKSCDNQEAEVLFFDNTQVFFVINDIFGLFEGKKPIKYMDIQGLDYSEPFSKTKLTMTYIESNGR